MKAFVTGATGFIGSHLADRLIAGNTFEEVRCLVRKREKWLGGKSYKKYQGDLHDLNVLKKAVIGVDVIFHLAGVVKASDVSTFEHVNVEATENLLRVAQKAGVSKIVILSSLAAVGPSNHSPVDENSPMQPVSAYGRSKKNMETMVRNVAGKKSSVTILRPPAVYGPREEQIYNYFRLVNYHLCPVIGDGHHPKISMVYVDDVIQGCLKAAAQRKKGIKTYFISGQKPHTWDDIRRITAEAMSKPTIPIRLKPAWVQKMAGVAEKSASFFGSYPVINRDKADELVLEWTCSINKARKELGYQPKYSLAEGISRTFRWYKKHHWL